MTGRGETWTADRTTGVFLTVVVAPGPPAKSECFINVFKKGRESFQKSSTYILSKNVRRVSNQSSLYTVNEAPSTPPKIATDCFYLHPFQLQSDISGIPTFRARIFTRNAPYKVEYLVGTRGRDSVPHFWTPRLTHRKMLPIALPSISWAARRPRPAALIKISGNNDGI